MAIKKSLNRGFAGTVTLSPLGRHKLLIHNLRRRREMSRPQGHSKEDQLSIDHMWEENHRLNHLTTILIQHLGTTKDTFPLADIDKQMKMFDEEHKY